MRSLARIRFESLTRKFIEPEDFDKKDEELIKVVLERYLALRFLHKNDI